MLGEQRDRWLDWTVAGYAQLADLKQPPYGERAVERRSDGELVGLVGLVPCLAPFGLIPGLSDGSDLHRFRPEVGLYWATAPVERGQGYAGEAAAALIEYGFEQLKLAAHRGHHRAHQPCVHHRYAKARHADRVKPRT